MLFKKESGGERLHGRVKDYGSVSGYSVPCMEGEAGTLGRILNSLHWLLPF